ncbi:MAG: hypothetical protein K9N23_18445, partial [Akkermansiaceae bacterium]|nr:hypothetical protein [Akkermansiaceae bacterium]
TGIELVAGGLTVNTAIETPSLTQRGGTLGGTGKMTLTGSLSWTGGTMNGTGSLVIASTATGALRGPAGKTLNGGWQLVNEGAFTLSGAGLTLSTQNGGNATLDNRGTFTVSDEADIAWLNFTGQPVFVTNSGTFIKSGAGTTTVLSPTQFTNSGEILVDSGTLQLATQTSHSGVLNTSAGSTLNLSSGTFTLAPAAALSVGGAMRFTGGTLVLNEAASFATGIELVAGGLTVNTAIEIPSLTQSGGTLGGTGIVTITGSLAWTGGTMTGSGSLVIAPTATGTISGPSGKSLNDGWQLVNEGTLTLGGANLAIMNSAGGANTTLDNRGIFTVGDEADIVWVVASFFLHVSVINSGTFVKSGAGTTTSLNPTNFTNSGRLSIQGGVLALTPFAQTATGITELAGGSLSASSLTFAAGRVTGVGTITANVTNSGAVFAPGETGTRTIGITGSYTQQAGGSLEVDLDGDAASGAFDKLAVSGAAALNGTVALRNALALTGEVFPLVTYASRSGTFPTITVTNNGSATASYLATRAEFSVTADDPPAGAPQLAASYADWISGVTKSWGNPDSLLTAPAEDGFTFKGATRPAGWDHDPLADPDGDGSVNLLEYAFQTNPLDPSSCSRLELVPDARQPGWLVATSRLRNAARDLDCRLEMSVDLITWQPVAEGGAEKVTIATRQAEPGIGEVTVHLNPAPAGRAYLRWSVRLGEAP